ncbi:hypothetical protein [Fulvivirga lutimaris]|uniref:hypothetical protein n=1 Tax=Fulvivirga lutimaris TaxID=1819566 RepID=UPI0012BC6198|nr:hypothetical protein [Fulvivirga lutimaris]MTI39744.1 hypothetical protein [Fulvivirga lutimaris]
MTEKANLLLISKNQHLHNLLNLEHYSNAWFNADLSLLTNTFDEDTILIYDSASYGLNPLRTSWLMAYPMIILGEYEKNIFIESLLETEQKAYLIIDDFIQELYNAIDCIKCGHNYVTKKIDSSVKNATCKNQLKL